MYISLLLLFTAVNISLAVDLTLIAKSSGRDVVDAIDFLIRKYHIFPANDDKGIFKRFAYAETKFGSDPQTYRANYHGGIWQVDEQKLIETKNAGTHPSLNTHYTLIKQAFNIDWPSVVWTDLEKPLYSGIAARLYLTLITAAIPDTIASQASYWKQYYTKNSTATVQTFIADISALENVKVCSTLMDIVLVLDGSGSITASKFDLAKTYVADLTDTFNLGNVRIGLILYSSTNQIVFNLNNNLSKVQMRDTILKLAYPAGSTATNAAILEAILMFESATKRDGVPQVMVVYTDGASDNGVATAVAQLKKTSITRFSVGIGTGINANELLQIADDINRVRQLSVYDTTLLTEFIYQVNSYTCVQSQKPALDHAISDALALGETRYYEFILPSVGLSILVGSSGQIIGYYSLTFERPSSAIYDGLINGPVYIPGISVSNISVYASIVGGSQAAVNYTLEARHGDFNSTCDKQLDFSPCRCIGHYEIICDATTNYRLEQVFVTANAKIVETTVIDYTALLLRNYINAVIGEEVFGEFRFETITIIDSRITGMHVNAFVSSATVTQNFTVSHTLLANQNSAVERDIFESVAKMIQLRNLDLSHNQLVTIPDNAFHPLLGSQRYLKSVRLDHNAITHIGDKAFYELPAIASINLSNNLIKQIGAHSFELKTVSSTILDIDLSQNLLEVNNFDKNWYDKTPRPLRLNVTGNKFHTISETIFSIFLNRNDNNTLLASNNPIVCDCSVKWLVEDRKYYKPKVIGAQCQDGRNVFDMSIDDFD